MRKIRDVQKTEKKIGIKGVRKCNDLLAQRKKKASKQAKSITPTSRFIVVKALSLFQSDVVEPRVVVEGV